MSETINMGYGRASKQSANSDSESNSVFNVQIRPTLLDYLNIAFAEFLGSGMLLFLSCMGNTLGLQGPISSMHISFTAGLSVAVAIQTFAHISGAHVNPVVTLSALILNEVTPRQAPIYIISQILGCLAGCGFQVLVTPQQYLDVVGHGVCVTAPHSNLTELQALGVETILSAILIFAICSSWDRRNVDKTDSVPLKIGLLVVVLNLAAAAYTGASMNPIRTLGPAVWTNDYTAHWVYWVGPTLGSLIATYFYKYIFLSKL